MRRQIPKRLNLILKYSLISFIGVFLAALLFFLLKPDSEPYRPGEKLEGITSTLDRVTPDDYPRIQFVDVAKEAGIDLVHFWGERSTQLPEDMGSGAAWGDFDGDGDLDLYVCSIAGPLTASLDELKRSPQHNRLYQNKGDGTFDEIALTAGVDIRSVSLGAAWGDFDEDRDLDLVVTNFGSIVMFRNEGEGVFTDVSREMGLADFQGFWGGVSWADYDKDNDLDFYVCGYVQYEYASSDLEKSTFQYEAAVPYTLNPSSYPATGNLLFRNEEGTFTEVAQQAGVENLEGRSLSASWSDLDGDGWTDLYIANDVSDNVLYRNNGDGTFEDVSHKAWVADYRGAMGLALGDWDNDLDIDLFITHWIAQENALFDNTRRFLGESTSDEPSMHFFDIADQTGLGQIALQYIGWGCSFLDYDNDGRQDLAVVNGSTFQEENDPQRLVPMQSLLFWNGGPEEGFFELGQLTGSGLAEPRVGRGLAIGDYDNDGDVDLFIVIHGGQPLLLRNEGGNRNHWLKVRVSGSDHNSFGFGARIEIHTSDLTQTQVIGAQASYMSQNALEAHFGLGQLDRVERLVIYFPCGRVEERMNVLSNQLIVVREGES